MQVFDTAKKFFRVFSFVVEICFREPSPVVITALSLAECDIKARGVSSFWSTLLN